MKRLFTAGLCLGMISLAAAQARSEQDDPAWDLPKAASDAVHFDFELKGYVLGLRMIKAQYTGYYNDTNYAARADLKTSGLGAFLKKLQIWAVSTGHVSPSANGLSKTLSPIRHVQQNRDKKNRRVEMDYDDGRQTVSVNIVPPLGSQGIPPANDAERYAADDTVSAIMKLMLQGRDAEGPLCNETVAVFDSKQHYNLRMVRVGSKSLKYDKDKYKSIICEVYYEPVSGFDPEDLPDAEESATPVMVYFTAQPIFGLHVPMRFTYKVSGFKAVIKVTDLKISPPPL